MKKGQSYGWEYGIVIREVTLLTVINNLKSSVAMLHINPPITGRKNAKLAALCKNKEMHAFWQSKQKLAHNFDSA